VTKRLGGIGVSGGSRPPLSNIRRFARQVEEQGASAVWWSDHLMGWHPDAIWPSGNDKQSTPHGFFDSFLLIADAARETDSIRLGVSVTDTFRRPPAVLAQTAGTLAHLTEGRFILGVGGGEAENAVPYGIEYRPTAGRMSEFVQVVDRLLTERGPISFEGKHFTLDGAALDLELPAAGRPPIWLAGSGPLGIRNVARHADGWIPVRLSLERYAELLGVLSTEAEAAGRSRDDITVGMLAWVVFANSKAEARELMKSPLIKLFALFAGEDLFRKHGVTASGADFVKSYIPNRLTRSEALVLADSIPDELVADFILHGNAEDIAADLQEYRKAGVDHPVVWNVAYFGDRDSIKKSFEQQAALLAIGQADF
jgi:phthiodiolone/phenolphthiodiolone dimycocerosates ketoreductase